MNIQHVMSSPAKFMLLRVFTTAQEPLSLRSLSSLANLAPRSTQLALNSLEKLGWVKSEYKNNRRLFHWTPKNQIVVNFFKELAKEEVQKSALHSLESIVQFSDEVLQLSQRK